jgi:hypothetical protein
VEDVERAVEGQRKWTRIALLLGAEAADAQATKDAKALREAGKAPHEGPVRKKDAEERRARRLPK